MNDSIDTRQTKASRHADSATAAAGTLALTVDFARRLRTTDSDYSTIPARCQERYAVPAVWEDVAP